jgi:hypothetical protein
VSRECVLRVVKNVKWTEALLIRDDNNGTWATQGYSLFGYSVATTPSGEYLAVGIPGNIVFSTKDVVTKVSHDSQGKAWDQTCYGNVDCLQNYPFDGCIRVYRRAASGIYSLQVTSQPPTGYLVNGIRSNSRSGDIFMRDRQVSLDPTL